MPLDLEPIKRELEYVPKSIIGGGEDYQAKLIAFGYFARDVAVPALLRELEALQAAVRPFAQPDGYLGQVQCEDVVVLRLPGDVYRRLAALLPEE